jgi:hypothetical protein
MSVLGKVGQDSVLLLLLEIFDLNFDLMLQIKTKVVFFRLFVNFGSFYTVFEKEMLSGKIKEKCLSGTWI